MATAYLGLGSNLGDRAGFIETALARLAAAGVTIAARSRLYETDAVADEAQPPYLNAAARVATELPARALVRLGLDIEHALGRRRPPDRRAPPREIDIDLLLHDGGVIDDPPHLVVPHPRLLGRPFVRVPLAEVALPGLIHPLTGEPLDRASDTPSVRLYRGR